MTFAPVRRSSRFRVEDALQETFEAVFANLGVFAPLALLLSAAPNLAATLAFHTAPGAAPFSGGFTVGVIVKPVVALLAAGLLQGAVTRGVLDHLGGRKPGFAACLRAALIAGPALAAIGLMFGLAVLAGMVLFVAPGLFLVALWTPAAGAYVAERTGVFGAFGRAAELTRGHRWAVLFGMIVAVVSAWIVSGVGSAVIGLVSAGSGAPLGFAGLFAGGAMTPERIVFAALHAVVTAFASLLTSAAPAAVYVGLARSGDAATPADLAAMFD